MSDPRVLQLAQTGFAALNAGRLAEAEDGADAALKLAPRDANALFLKGAARYMAGDAAGAIAPLKRADKAAPGQVNILNMLAMAEWDSGHAGAARKRFETLLKRHPQAVDPLYNLGRLLRDVGEKDAAIEKLTAAIKIQPRHVGAYSALARLHADAHDLDAAKPYADELLALDPGDPLGLAVSAQIDMRADQARQAADRLTAGLALNRGSAVNRALAYGRLGEALDKLSDHDAAWDAYGAANHLLRERFASFASDTGFYSQAHAQLQAEFWASPPNPGQEQSFKSPAPVFLVGFPRSGTTLLENILAAHPDIESVEEQDLLLPVLDSVAADEKSLSGLCRAAPARIESLRRKYWRTARPQGQPQPGQIFIDKYPLNLIYLGVISRVFPDARILFALRDPRDCVVSAFQQRFGMNAAMYRMLSAEDAAAFYDQSMQAALAGRGDLNVLETRYEDMVADWRAEAVRILEFLGLDWHEAVDAYRDQLQTKTINTPSAPQVVQPIYSHAAGKWRRYDGRLEAVRPTLDRWAAHWGYDT